ncbi:MAG: hypothetical protein V6Z86_07785 [Hyphomicrobiales bacterium]
MRTLGDDIVSWCEASLVYISPEHYLNRHVPTITPRYISRFFAWGDADGEMIAAAPQFRGIPVEANGNPRADLLWPELRDLFREQADELNA